MGEILEVLFDPRTGASGKSLADLLGTPPCFCIFFRYLFFSVNPFQCENQEFQISFLDQRCSLHITPLAAGFYQKLAPDDVAGSFGDAVLFQAALSHHRLPPQRGASVVSL